MNQMVERVAQAIEDQLAADASSPPDLARAAITAMRNELQSGGGPDTWLAALNLALESAPQDMDLAQDKTIEWNR